MLVLGHLRWPVRSRLAAEAGFAGREARPGRAWHALEEGARGGTRGSPAFALQDRLAERTRGELDGRCRASVLAVEDRVHLDELQRADEP
jgi:hypothetical protein